MYFHNGEKSCGSHSLSTPVWVTTCHKNDYVEWLDAYASLGDFVPIGHSEWNAIASLSPQEAL